MITDRRLLSVSVLWYTRLDVYEYTRPLFSLSAAKHTTLPELLLHPPAYSNTYPQASCGMSAYTIICIIAYQHIRPQWPAYILIVNMVLTEPAPYCIDLGRPEKPRRREEAERRPRQKHEVGVLDLV